MFKISSIVVKTLANRQCSTSKASELLRNNKLIDISSEVSDSLLNKKPIVALESTIITHGMPYPTNLQCAMEVENIIRKEGATPATIAIINGRVKVGLNSDELKLLSNTGITKSIKTSRRDFPYVLANKLNGGTTVSGTIVIANQLDIPVFVTGGIGGVHRFGEQTMDVSADLTELGRNNIAVISAGVKSILDIPRTLEYLETQGVLVSVFGDTKDFPAFYSRQSGSTAPYNVINSKQAAELIQSSQALNLKSGLLFAVPIPEEYALDANLMEISIQECLKLAKEQKIEGKYVTPFLLEYMSKVTKGKSLESNLALIKNNAKIGAKISVELAKLQNDSIENVPVIFGGAITDFGVKILDKEIQLDCSTHETSIFSSGGGVGRNICEALVKLGNTPKFISAVGTDANAEFLERQTSPQAFKTVLRTSKHNTAQFILICDHVGECKIGLGDMNILKSITPNVIRSHESSIQTAPILILDSNLDIETLGEALTLATKHNVPVFYEPTDPRKSEKIFKAKNYSAIKFMTPNLAELRNIAKHFGISATPCADHVSESAEICELLSDKLDLTFIVTLGPLGVLIASRREANQFYFNNNKFIDSDRQGKLLKRHYRTKKLQDIVNVNGAGDCWASGFIAAILDGLSEEQAVDIGFKASLKALYSQGAVPQEMFSIKSIDLSNKAKYEIVS